jgi:hypothetical protein
MIQDWILAIFCLIALIAIPAELIWVEWYIPNIEKKKKSSPNKC